LLRGPLVKKLLQLVTWLPNEALHLGSEDNIDLVLFNEFDQPLEVGALFLEYIDAPTSFSSKMTTTPRSQEAILDVTPGLLETFGNLN